MNVTLTAPLLALAIVALGGSCVRAQAMDAPAAATPAAPRLLAPKSMDFKRNAADPSPASITRERWFAAHGSWKSSTEDGLLEARTSFAGLVPNGHYSLFSEHTAGGSMRMRPLDQSGSTSSFVASPEGTAVLTITLAQQSMPGDEILLVYHTNDVSHAKTIGKLGTDAFIQLRMKQP